MTTDPSSTKTTSVDLTLDVISHIRRLTEWHEEWERDDTALEQRILQLNPDNRSDVQKGSQISTVRRRKRLRLAKEPLEINSQTLTPEFGYKDLRRYLVQQFASLSRESKLRWLWVYLFMLTPEFRELTNKIETVRRHISLGQQRNFLLGGPSGSGKTTMTDWYASNNMQVIERDFNRVPAIKIDAPVSNHTPKPLFQRIILECGYNYLRSDNEEELLQKIALLFQLCHVEILIIDEIEHLRTHDIRRRVLEISNMTRGIPIICASCNPLQWKDGDIEIEGRWGDYFRLEPYTGEKLSALLSYIELLLPFTQPSNLARFQLKDGKNEHVPGPAAFIQDWTGGIIRDIMILIIDASITAIHRGDSHLTLTLLHETWARIKDHNIRDVLTTLKHTGVR